MKSRALIEARDVWFRYHGQRAWTLRGASLQLDRGRLAVVVGPNGGGKTTLLKTLAGLYRPQKGCTCIEGVDIWHLPEKERLARRRKIVYVHEEPVMLRGSVLDNVAAGLLLRGVDRGTAYDKARKALGILGLEDYAGARARSLSRGLRQLVAVARALALDPSALLLDEPFAHLDREKRRLLLRLIVSLVQAGKTVAVASHNAHLLARHADLVVAVEEGSVEIGGRDLLEELA
jgi:energy-coupling factor transporter ATP-binding protein EcfA2